jgi:hypothetical protein
MEVSQAPRFTATAVPSVLQRPGAKPVPEPDRAPDCFSDLNLDQLIAAVTEGREQYDLRPAFHAPLLDAADVAYRYEVFRDLADVDLRDDVASFSRALTRFRDRNRGGADPQPAPVPAAPAGRGVDVLLRRHVPGGGAGAPRPSVPRPARCVGPPRRLRPVSRLRAAPRRRIALRARAGRGRLPPHDPRGPCPGQACRGATRPSGQSHKYADVM